MTIATKLSEPDSNIHRIAEWLDGMDHAARMDAMGATTKAQQKRLWALARESAPLTAQHFVPDGVADRTEVVHHGRNTLPVPGLKSFQKRFCRPTDGTDRLFGYNEGWTRSLIGPGYFVLHDTAGQDAWGERGAVVVDYFQVPDGDVVDGWPKVVPNSRGLQVLVYHHTRDFMRRVSAHVSIGMAFKNESSMNNWFTLIREDPG